MAFQILIQDLPAFVNPKKKAIKTVDKSKIASFFKQIDPNMQLKFDIVTRTNADGTPFAYAMIPIPKEQYMQAISELNNTLFEGKRVHIKIWTNELRNIFLEEKWKIIIRNLSPNVDVDDLYSIASKFGNVVDCIIPSRDDKSFSYGIVQFDDSKTANEAILELNGEIVKGQKIEVFQLNENKVNKAKKLWKNYQELTIFSGQNIYNQLYYQSTNKNIKNEEIISPPLNYPLINFIDSYSIYNKFSVTIYQNGCGRGIGNNKNHAVYYNSLENIDPNVAITFKRDNIGTINLFQSAVCGSLYTLYLCKPQLTFKTNFLLYVSTNNPKPLICDNGVAIQSIYGGEKTCAAIDVNGSVIILNDDNNEFVSAKLPKNKKAVLLACLDECVIALSSDGYLFEFDLDKNEFEIIPEIADIQFTYVSGVFKHCLAVDELGSVYMRVSNDQLGINSSEESEPKFTKLDSFTDDKIVSAFAGFDHSLFLTEKGSVFACGKNDYGQLMLNTCSDSLNNSYNKPIQTVVSYGATFCIAGHGLSVVFLFNEPPQNSPNMKIHSEAFNDEVNNVKAEENYKVKNEENDEIDNKDDEENDSVIDDVKNQLSLIKNNMKEQCNIIGQLVNENDSIKKMLNKINSKIDDMINSKHINDNDEERENSDNDNLNDSDNDYDNESDDDKGNDSENENEDGNENDDENNNDNENANDNASDDDSDNENENDGDNENDNNIDNENDDDIEIIQFSQNNVNLNILDSVNWPAGNAKKVEFFKDEYTKVTVLSINDHVRLKKALNELDDNHPLSIDFEWRPDFNAQSNNPISLIQICSSKGVLIVLNSKNILNKADSLKTYQDFKNECPIGLPLIKKFLSSHSFYGKGMGCDKRKLQQLFGKTFDFEDLSVTRITPHKLTNNFENLVQIVRGKTAAPFKNKKVSKSNWNKRPLSAKQIIYAAFDAYATRLFWLYFIEKFGEEEVMKPSKKSKKSKKKTDKKKNNE